MPSNMQQKIDHVVVLMLENRSMDNLLGWLYGKDETSLNFIPSDSPARFNGLDGTEYSNPINLDNPEDRVEATAGVDNYFVPDPDPNEHFKHMNQQLFGLDIDKNTEGWLPPENATPSMQGFLADYATAKHTTHEKVRRIMQTYTNDELTVLSSLAKNYAVSDNYHASSPTQTWPNRAFMHAGTSLGQVNNWPYIPYTCKTLLNVLEKEHVSWKVYKSSRIIPSLTRIQMVQLWNPFLSGHFKHLDDFVSDCETGDLPAYSFLEPRFAVEGKTHATSEHPPVDVCTGDYFLQTVWKAVVTSPAFERTLFILNFDEHGGCPDHVAPNWTAIPPDAKSSPGKQGFGFNRFGVRVPAIFASPHIASHTVFRAASKPGSPESVPYDHCSIIAMILDWKKIDRAKLPSARVQAAPQNPFDDLLDGSLRSDRPEFAATCPLAQDTNEDRPLSSLQKSIVAADAHYRSASAVNFKEGALASPDDVDKLLSQVTTESEMEGHFQRLYG
jgi:phospholipase C